MNLEGWVLVNIPGFGTHNVPVNDIRTHLDSECPCRPEQNEDMFWNHNSFDGREAFETGERLVS